MDSKEKLIQDFSILSGAAIGVMILRTKEPYRMLENLKGYARSKSLLFNLWKINTGWSKYKLTCGADDDDVPTIDRTHMDILPAFEWVGQTDNTADAKAKGTIYAMMWPHHFCSKGGNNIPHIIQWISDYAQQFTEIPKRLILVVPPEYSMPPELEECVTLLDCELPDKEELRESYEDIMEFAKTQTKDLDYDDEDVERILSAGAGMTVGEFESAISRAIKKFSKELPDVPIEDFVTYISVTKAELVKRSEVLELMPLGSMEDVGGLENLKSWINLQKFAFEEEAREFGVDKPSGCMLIGPPGTGKSLCAKAVAHALSVPLIRFDISRVFAQFVGSSEGRVREALKMIRAMSPCVVLVDEADKAFDQKSGGGDSGVGKRVLGAILTEMQESPCDVFWIMTANRVDGLPAELLRKGRLDEIFSVTTPSEAERLAILKIHLAKRNQDPDMKGLKEIAENKCAEFVGAEIEGAIKQAVLIAYSTGKEVTADLIGKQFDAMTPLSQSHKAQFDEMAKWAAENATPSSEGAKNTRQRERVRADGAGPVGKRSRRLSEDT